MARLPPGPWRDLLAVAIRLVDDVETQVDRRVQWSFGGGTVLMLRYGHRRSKDIDIFVSDAQLLGYLSPRLSSLAESICDHYVESSEHIKLYFPQGEIDFVATPSLTDEPTEQWRLLRRTVAVETAVEIVSKKCWYRGNVANARDLFDLALVVESEPLQLAKAKRFLVRHRTDFLGQLRSRESILMQQFREIDALRYRPTYEHCVDVVTGFLNRL